MSEADKAGLTPHTLNRFDWNEAAVAKLTKLWKDGLSASQIARCLGSSVTRNTVIGKANRLGLKHGKASNALPWTEERLAEVRRLFAQGYSGQRIAEIIGGTSKASVNHRLAAMGLNLQPRAPQLIIAGNGTVLEKPDGQAPKASAPAAEAWAPLPGSNPVLLIDRAPFMCRWPIDWPAEDISRCCGLAAPSDRYCEVHEARSRAAVQPRQLRPSDLEVRRRAA